MTSTIETGTTPPPHTAVAARRAAARGPARFLVELARGPLVLDAGMGTRLLAHGLDPRRDDPCLWNLDHPAAVLATHRRDADAGARALFTNTFGANRAWLSRTGRPGDLVAINRAAVELARRAAGPSGFVVGDIGPSAVRESGAAAEQADVLAAAEVDALVLETFRLEEALEALRQIRRGRHAAGLPVLASLWQWPEPIEAAARRLIEAGADVLGLNCRPALREVLPVARRIAAAVACPLLVKPGVAPGDAADDSTPAAFAAVVPDLIDANVRLIGGCCGTTEAHVAAIAGACALHRLPTTPDRRGAAP